MPLEESDGFIATRSDQWEGWEPAVKSHLIKAIASVINVVDLDPTSSNEEVLDLGISRDTNVFPWFNPGQNPSVFSLAWKPGAVYEGKTIIFRLPVETVVMTLGLPANSPFNNTVWSVSKAKAISDEGFELWKDTFKSVGEHLRHDVEDVFFVMKKGAASFEDVLVTQNIPQFAAYVVNIGNPVSKKRFVQHKPSNWISQDVDDYYTAWALWTYYSILPTEAIPLSEGLKDWHKMAIIVGAVWLGVKIL